MTAGSPEASAHTILIRRLPDSESELDDILEHHSRVETRYLRCLALVHAHCLVRRLGDETGALPAKQQGGEAAGTG